MPALRERVKVDGEILTFADTEPIQALQTIMEQRPELVVLERLFAATPRGAALINRIKSDPQLAHAEVRVMSHTGDYTRQVVKPSAAVRRRPAGRAGTTATAPQPSGSPVATEEAPQAARLARHAPRAALPRRGRASSCSSTAIPPRSIDLSTVGAQVISPTVLRPNQKVRITHARSTTSCCASAARSPGPSSSCRKPPVKAPQYRAGVEFTDADADGDRQFSVYKR